MNTYSNTTKFNHRSHPTRRIASAAAATVTAGLLVLTMSSCITFKNERTAVNKVDQQVGGFVAGSVNSKENLAQLATFAKCMRDNGVANFPEANKDNGNFNPSAEVIANKNFDSAYDICKPKLEGAVRDQIF